MSDEKERLDALLDANSAKAKAARPRVLTAKALRALIADVPDDMEIWITHPEDGYQWGGLVGGGLSVTDRFQRIFIFDCEAPDD